MTSFRRWKPNVVRLKPVLLALNLALIVTFTVTLFMLPGEVLFTDLYSFLSGWRLTVGNGSTYDFGQQAQEQVAMLARPFRYGVLPYVSPPHFTLLLGPFALLPLPWAVAVWNLGQLGALAAIICILWRYVPRPRIDRALLITGALALPPVYWTLVTGQLSILMALCMLQLYRHQDSRQGGVWLFVGLFKPQLFVLPVAWLLARRRKRRPLLTAGALLVVAALYATTWCGADAWSAWGDTLKNFGGYYDHLGVDPSNMLTLRGLLTRALGNHHPAVNPLSYAALGLVGLALMRHGGMGLALGLGVFLSPHLNNYDLFVLVAPAAVWAGLKVSLDLTRTSVL